MNNDYLVLIAIVCLIIGWLLNKFGTWKKFCQIWSILSTVVSELESLIQMIESEIPDDTDNYKLRKIDNYCKKGIICLKYAKLFLEENHIKNGKKKEAEPECSIKY